MTLVAIGVEHKTAPLAVRERLAPDPQTLDEIHRALVSHAAITEAAVLSTCNRIELYLVTDDVEQAVAEANGALVRDDENLLPYIQRWVGSGAVDHVFRVAAGLESQMLGEREVLAQVRESLARGERLETIGPELHMLLRSAIRCARQARIGTRIGQLDRSLGTEAVALAERELGDLTGKQALVIGGGKIARVVAKALRGKQLERIFIANRTPAVALELAREVGGTQALFSGIPRLASEVDLVISATSAPRYVLTTGMLADTAARTSRLHLVDLAIPRDIDPAVASLEQVTLHDLEDLISEGMERAWDADIRHMESVIAGEVREYEAWSLTRRVVPVIANLRSHVEAVQRQELQRIEPQLRSLGERERQAIEGMTNRLVDKMFHHLVLRLRLAAQTDPTLVEAAEFFFLHGEGSLFPHAAESTDDIPTELPRT
jgi:glutamyl-tRNA reductase